MKALTIRQPYASLVMCGAKPYEFRTWRTRYRGPLVIHSGAAFHAWHSLQWRKSRAVLDAAGYLVQEQLPRGALLGVVELVDCISCDGGTDRHPLNWRQPPEHCGQFDAEMFALVLERPRELRTPIPATGKLGFWTVAAEHERHLARL